MHVTFILILLAVVNARKMRKDLVEQSQQESIEDDNKEANEVKSNIHQQPVIFSHVNRQGFGDTEFKQPVDGLELDMVKPRDHKHALELLEKSNGKNIQLLPRHIPIKFLSPRDEMEYYKRFYNTTDTSDKQKLIVDHSKISSGGPIYDFASILEQNIANPFAHRRIKAFDFRSNKKSITPDIPMVVNSKNITDFFEENRFYAKPDNRRKINWTTCDEFANKAVFHPNDVINTKWLPFFIWSKRELTRTVVHTFSYPTKKNVQYFKTKYGPHLININWREPKLLLKERRTILLIAGDRKGLFYGIPDQELPSHPMFKNITLQVMKLRLKIHDPYLAMMYCDENYAAIMAELGTEPTSENESILEAGTLHFKGRGFPVYRNVEEEKFIATMEKKRKKEDESKKFIRIHKLTGNVDAKVNH